MSKTDACVTIPSSLLTAVAGGGGRLTAKQTIEVRSRLENLQRYIQSNPLTLAMVPARTAVNDVLAIMKP